MAVAHECQTCGEPLEILRHPLRRLRWTRYWWEGLLSLVSQPLRFCAACGSIYRNDGHLLATGAAETAVEVKAGGFRDDMINIRDGFGTIVIASEIAVIWTLAGPGAYSPAVSVLAGVVGGAALVPFSYFALRARKAKKELKRLKVARLKGETSE
jgi:hypothetical protein